MPKPSQILDGINYEELEEAVSELEEQEEDAEGEAEEVEVEVDEEEEEADDWLQTQDSQEFVKGTSGADINIDSFDELRLQQIEIEAANDAWRLFINAAESREAAGEAIYAALFEGAPSLQSLFVTPRAVQAMKFMNGLASFVQALDEPPRLKTLVETLGFGHLHLDVTVPRVVIFRDAILDLLSVELAERFNSAARDGWKKLLNYVGGAIIFVKAHFAERINTLLNSWAIVNDSKTNKDKFKILDSNEVKLERTGTMEGEKQIRKKGLWNRFAARRRNDGFDGAENAHGKENEMEGNSQNQVPTTYNEMFMFNAAVMGFGTSMWFNEVLACFDNIVTNVSNSARLQEECEVLVLRISRVVKGSVNFAEYKSCMLASLRSLLPKDWSTAHEVAWSWLWENVERILTKLMGSPPRWEKALSKLMLSIDETTAFELRKDIYARFFSAAPAGQDYFKQSNTYLHFIADRVLQMTVEMYNNPVKMTDDVSALGLRHVGYAIPTELFSPFVTACVEVLGTTTDDDDAVEAFRWSLGLISKMLVRTITEGSTIVMKAINMNSVKTLKKAIGCAPRGERASWMLIVQVGTQDISPLSWAIESGAMESAKAMIQDLLSFRADRDRYYYGMDQLFKRHPDVISRLCNDAPSLVPVLLDGLVWRSRVSENGMRRVNYYFKHLLLDEEGFFSPTLSWIAKTKDPKLVCHPVIVLLSDTIWNKVAAQAFLYRRSWFLFTLLVFICGQSIMKHMGSKGMDPAIARDMTAGFRLFIYLFNMCQLLWQHITKVGTAYKTKATSTFFGITYPSYLRNWQDAASFVLTTSLVCMLSLEPILWCLTDNEDEFLNGNCKDAEDVQYWYALFSMFAVFLYFALLIDLAVMSTKVSAYVLVCIRMISEVGLFLLALGTALLCFSCSITVLKHSQKDFEGIHKGLLALLEMATNMYDGEHFELYESDPMVLTCVFVFLFVTHIFLVNMLIAQLTCAYESVYSDMVGYARLERIEIINVTMPVVSEQRWKMFLQNLRLTSKIEFNQGDVGVSGGVQTTEPAAANVTTVDAIKRFGGSTSVELQWPAEEEGEGDENDRFDKLENLIHKTLKRITKSKRSGSVSGSGMSGSGSGIGSGSFQDKSHSGSGGSEASMASDDP